MGMLESLNLTNHISTALLLVAFAWILYASFSHGLLWGLSILFLSPFSTIAFAYNFWNEAKKPIIAFTLAFAFNLYTFSDIFTITYGLDIANYINEGRSNTEDNKQKTTSNIMSSENVQAVFNQLNHQLNQSHTQKSPTATDKLEFGDVKLTPEIMQLGMARLTGTLPLTEITGSNPNSIPKKKQMSHPQYPPYDAKTNEEILEELFGKKETPTQEQLEKHDRLAKAMHKQLQSRFEDTNGSKLITNKELPKFIGKMIDVHLIRNHKHTGILSKISKSHISIYRNQPSGKINFDIERGNISKIFLSQQQ